MSAVAQKYKRVIHWFRRDLRIKDNTALNAACRTAGEVIPAYVISGWKGAHRWTGPNRQQFLCGCLESLAMNLESIDGRLIFRRGVAVDELMKLARETEAEAIFFNRDPDHFGREMEARVTEACHQLGIEAFGYKDHVLHEPDEVLTQMGGPYRVFTPYGKNWRSIDKQSVGAKAKKLNTPPEINSLKCPTLKTWRLPQMEASILSPGERAARARLKKALEGPLLRYGARRNLPAGQTTSRLGQDLRFGLLSIREVYAKVIAASDSAPDAIARDSLGTFISELAWREFYMAVLAHWPEVFEFEFNPSWRGLPWQGAGKAFETWCAGQTGFPIVDAGMRELRATGFMHNRVRMIVAMFLTKDLRIDWRHGESYFMQQLVDGENASNNGGWQWSAGTGADAAPYFRVQNPWTQTKNYDPDGEYIHKWVPELKGVDGKMLYTAPKPGVPVTLGYPAPMVDHKQAREEVLAMFAKHRGSKD